MSTWIAVAVATAIVVSLRAAFVVGVDRLRVPAWFDRVGAHVAPAMTAALLARHGGADHEGFAAYLHGHHFDLHYRPLAQARPFSMGIGHLWRLAVQFPGSRVPGCVHRAPTTLPGDPQRLLLIS